MALGARFQVPYVTLEDSNGVPLPGAQLFFYVSGGFTPTNSYSNSSLTTPNPNPVVANAAGQFPNIFLNPAITYRVVAEDQFGNALWTADPVAQLGSLLGPTLVLEEAAAPAGASNAITLYTPDAETLEYIDGANTNWIVQTQPAVANTGNFTNPAIAVDFGGRVIAAASGSINAVNGAEFSYTVSSGTASDLASTTASTWNKRSLNTTNYNGITGCSISSNSVTLPTGIYFITYSMAFGIGGSGGSAVGRLRDTTDSLSFANSPEVLSSATAVGLLVQSAIFSITGNKVFELDMYTSASTVTGGTAASTGDSEVYVRLSILQIGN